MRSALGLLRFTGLFLLFFTHVYAQGQLTNVTATPSNAQAGAFTVYAISFQPSATGNGVDSGLPADGQIVITFPAGFSVANVEIASNVSGLDGGYSSITVSGQSVTLVRDNTGTALAAGASATIKIASVGNITTAGSYTVQVETRTGAGTTIDGPTTSAAFAITAASLDHFVFNTIANQTAGQAFSVTVTARDAYENDVSHTGTVTLSDNTGTLTASNLVFSNQTSQTITDATITKAQSGVFLTATGSGISSNSNTFTINPGPLHHLHVVEGTSGPGDNLPAQSITTDQSLNLHAAGYDAWENYIADEAADWQVTGGIGSFSNATNTATTTFFANTIGSGTITAVHPTAQDGTTGLLTVTVGAAHHVKVLTDAAGNTAEVTTAGLSANEQLIVHAASFDADDNYIGDVSVNWSVSGGIGTLSPTQGTSTTLTAITVGTGQITADHATLIDDATGIITVNAGALAYVKIVEGPEGDGPELGARSLTADDVLQVHAAGYDAAGNYLGDVSVTWSSTGTLAPTVSGTGTSATFRPTTAPASGSIIADHATATDDTTGTISVTQGTAHHVKILNGVSGETSEVQTAGLTTNQQLTVHAASFDADDNYIQDVSVNWSVSGGIGTLSAATGISTTLTATTPGTGQITADHATLLDDATGTITVSVGSIASIRIIEGPFGDGPELANRTMTADEILTVHAAGFDAAGNYIGDVSVDWSSTGTLAPAVSGTSVSITFSPTTAPASGTIVATHATAGGDATGTITVNPGAEYLVKVMTGAGGNTSEMGTATMTTGDAITVHASSFDADGNYIQDVSVDWDVSGGIGTLNPLQGVSTTLTATTPGTGQITADHATLIDDATGTITVNEGSLAFVKIVEGPSGDGPELGARSLTADEQLVVHAAGYDASGNYIGDVAVTWSSTGNLTPSVSGTSTSVTFSPTLAPASGTIQAVHATATGDETGTISVTVGAPHHVKVMSGAAGSTTEVGAIGLTTGDAITVHASSFDADDNYIDDVSVNWSVSGGIGSLFPGTGISTTFTATTAGTGQITADHATLLDDATGTITVGLGDLAYIKIIEGPEGDGTELGARSLTTDDVLILHAAGYDAQGNYLGDQTVTWSSTGTLSPTVVGSGPSITFSPDKAPASGLIIASHASATGDTTGIISVSVGQAHRVKVLSGASGETNEVQAAGLTTGDQLTVHAGSFDADDNYIGDVSVNWSVSGGIGTLSAATGISTTLTATAPGTGQITADHATLIDDATGTITVNSGTLAFVKIVEGPSGDGPELNTKNLTADDVLTVHAAGYDAQGNYIGDQTVTWSSTGNLEPAINSTGTSLTFSPKAAPASGTIVATHASAQGDETGTISVSVGAEHHVKVLNGVSGNTTEVGNVGLTTGETFVVHAASFDADDNYIQDVSVNWTVSGSIGTLSPTQGISTTLTATTPGTGQITADHATLFDDATGTITVNSGSLSYVKIVEGPSGDGPELGAKSLTADDVLIVHAAGYDAQGNYLGDVTVDWTSTGTLAPAVNETAIFISFSPTTAPASGTLRISHATATGDETGTISVSVGAEHHVKVLTDASGNTPEMNTANLTTGDQLIVHAASFDADDNYIQDVSVSWSVSGGIGTLNPLQGISTTLTATSPGTGQITADHATLIDDATGTITVNSGSLSYVKIVEGPSGDGPELGAKSLTADDVLIVHAAGYDAQGNYLGDVTVTWQTIGTLAPAANTTGTSFTFSPTTAPASGTITASHATATGDQTGTISVSVGQAHHLKVLSDAAGNSNEVVTAGLTTGDQLTLHAASFDADENYIEDVSVSWSVSGGIGTLNPLQGVSTTLTATTPGSGQITASHASLIDDATGTITVNAGNLAYIKIVEGPSGDGPELDAKNLTADDALTVHAAGYDAQDNYLGDQTVTWSSTGTLAPVISGSGTSITFNPTTAPASGRIHATHATAGSDSTGLIQVAVGVEHHVKVLSDAAGNTPEVGTTGLTTGDQLVVHAASFDADDNYIQDVSVNWSVSGGIGTLNPLQGVSTTLTATSPGTGQITADHATLIDDATGTITVNSGTLAYIKIVEGPSGDGAEFGSRNMTADDVLTLHAAGYDAQGNYLGDQTVTWSSTGTLAPVINASGTSITFSPTTAPASGTIVATHATATGDETGTINVAVGTERYVKILSGASGLTGEVGNANLVTGDTLRMHAASFDADNNYVADVSVNWLISQAIGTLNPTTGVSTLFTASTAGSAVITADHATLIDDATGTITVTAGALSYVKIVEGPSGDGPELGARTLTTDDVLVVHAAGYDAQGNYLGDQSVTWSVSGGIGTVDPVIGTSTTLTLTTPGTGRILADHATAQDDSTGLLTVNTGSLYRVKVLVGSSGEAPEVGAQTLTTDETLVVHAGGFDVDDNYIGDVSVNWGVSGGIGVVSPSAGVFTTFDPQRVGNGQITADHATAIDGQSGILTINPGALAYIKIIEGPAGDGPELLDRSLTTDQTLTLHAAGFDADSNYVGEQSVDWSSTGTLAPAITGTGTRTTFEPNTAPASGTIRATHATAGSDETGTISVTPGKLHHVEVLTGGSGETSPLGPTTMNPGQTLLVHAGGFDADNNYISDVVVNWSVVGPIGSISPASGISATFTAQTVGTGTIRADASGDVLDASSGTITVSTGSVAKIIIRTAPGNGGVPFGDYTLTADEEITLYAAGYDAGDNYFGDVNVTWSSTGNLTPAASGTGSSFTFSPISAAADGSVNGTIIASFDATIKDTTGVITVLPGAPVGDVTLTPDPATLPANGTATSVITSSVIQDAENNPVGSGRLFTVSATPANLGTIVTPDADAITPGHQIATNAASQLNLTYRAGTTGGVVTINVSSGLAASGQTQITLGSLSILAITTAPTTVTQGQTGITVSMSVQNLGSSPIGNLLGNLSFTGTADRTAEYTVTASASNPTTLPGNATVTLTYLVDVSAAASLETVTIDGTVSGQVNGTPVSATGAQTPDSWTVQRPAQVSIQTVTGTADTVSQGQTNLTVSVRVANRLGAGQVADALIDSVRLVFKQGPVDVSGDYVVAANQGNPTVVPGNGFVDLTFTVNVGIAATLGLTTIDAIIYARDANSNQQTQDTGADTPHQWTVVEGNAFSIVSITSSQPQVTQGMLKEWQIVMQVRNSGSSAIELDLTTGRTALQLRLGSTDVTAQYTIVPPTAMDEGGVILAANSTGHLTFRVTKTGQSTGIVTISGVARGVDLATGQEVSDNTNDSGTGEVVVQSPGLLNIDLLQPSQTTVTAGRTRDWTVTATVRNPGGSAIQLAANPVTFSVGDNAGYQYILPTLFADGDSIIDANETKQIVVTVDQAGTSTGTQPILMTLSGIEINSGRAVVSNQGASSVQVQSPAQLQIVDVLPSRTTVTAGQTNPWTITVVVSNTGESQVQLQTDTTTTVRFRLGTQVQSDYQSELQPPRWLASGTSILAGNQVDSLKFAVTKTGAATGFLRFLVQVSVVETNSDTTLTLNVTSNPLVEVQSPPLITYISGSMVPDVVNNNGFYAFKVRVNNAGQSTVELEPAITTFTFTDGNNTFTAPLDANKVTVIAPGDTTLTFQQRPIPANMQHGAYTPSIELRGTENGNGFARSFLVDSNELQVSAPASVQVVSLRPSQPTVTSQMARPWFISMVVANNGGTNIELDSVNVALFNGGAVTQEYTIVKPTAFLGSGSTTLAAGQIDSLRFDVLKTGVKLGATTIQGRLWVHDVSTQEPIFIQTDSGGGSFVVQQPALLQIVSIEASQPRVTRGQTQPWTVDMTVANPGESAVQIDFRPGQTGLLFSLMQSDDYTLTLPTAFVNGDSVLPGNGSATLRYIVTKTGNTIGDNVISGFVAGVEINSGRALTDDTADGGLDTVRVETPARLRVRQVDVFHIPNPPYVNISQPFTVLAVVENFGQEKADSVRVSLSTSGNSIISQSEYLMASGLEGGQVDSVLFTVTAGNQENPAEVFRAAITSAIAHNTGLTAPVDPAVDDTATVAVQLPAVLDITEVLPSVPQVAAEQNIPWEIWVVVRNSGVAAVTLKPPVKEDIQISLDGVVQRDYVIEPPTGLTIHPDWTLPGGAVDTLKFRVVVTGRLGGRATLLAQVHGVDQNSLQEITTSNAGSVTVETTAAVRIFKTEPLVLNRVPGTEIGLVNVSRTFNVRVLVENTGFEDVENVQVQLRTGGRSLIPIDTVNIASIQARSVAQAVFQVQADSLPTPDGFNETFTARILRAIAAQSKEPAAVFLAADSIAQVRIQLPARLTMVARLDDEDQILSTNQIFEVRATVQNLGQAEIDMRGRLQLVMPPSFQLQSPATFVQLFRIDEPVVWKVKAPATEVPQALFVIKFSQLPLDRNSGKLALTEIDSVRLAVKVVQFDLSITRVFISEPDGAQDDTLSTGQNFKMRARIAFSEDLAGRPRSIRLIPPPGYTLLSPAVIQDFSNEETWALIAPSQPHGPRWFRFEAEGTTGTSERVRSTDSLRVVLVSRALLELQAFISEPEGARDNSLTVGQRFTIRANLNNLGTAGTIDTARVRLELGQTGITVTDTLEKPIDVNGFVEWQARAPESPAEGAITVRLIQRPLDENSGQDVDVVSEISRFFVRTDTVGSLTVSAPVITGPDGALDNILSTGQPFTVQANLEWRHLRQVSAVLELPTGFFTEEARRNFADSDTRATPSWIVRAPEDAAAAQLLTIRVQAIDANNDSLTFETVSEPLQVEVVERASLRLSGAITRPVTATDGIVSVNQPFEITAMVLNEGQAPVVGESEVRIVLPVGYSTEDTLVKRTENGVATWRVKAKNVPSTGIEQIRLVLEKLPKDGNSGLDADVVVGEVEISIQTEPRLLRVSKNQARPSGPTGTGEQDVPMMSLIFENQGRELSSAMLLRGLTLLVFDLQGEPVAPNRVIQAIRVVRHGQPEMMFGERMQIPAENPVQVQLTPGDTLLPGVPDTLDVLVDLAGQSDVTGMQLRFASSADIDVIDLDSGEPVQVVDESGASGQEFAVASKASVITEADFKNFYNYPNPFQPGDPPDRGTRFWYYLPSNSRVEFKILTLLGELVYQKTYEANSPQGQKGSRIPGYNDIFWDGRNGEGKVVLNGIYIAVLKTDFGVVTTKVAVAK
ncbi:MAG: hypothetical protein Q9P90_04250 [candidate division KSB1 bacterium]|nr:hypothetical protein [candidate division KSB1 bacterium]